MLTPFNPDNLDGLTREEQDKTRGFDVDWTALADQGESALKKHHGLLFKWSGVYGQLQKGFYMLRVRVPGGLLSSDQCRVLAEAARRYAQDRICITTRQSLQFHWIHLHDIAAIFDTLAAHGMTTKNACGDVPRNLCCCQWSGVCPAEKANARADCAAVEEAIIAREDLRNLPRKFKINFSGCEAACAQPYTNDAGWVGTEYNGQAGYMLFGCGGLGSRPFLGKKIFDFVPPDLVTPVTLAMAVLFREWGNRKNRALARSKYVMREFGLQKYQSLLLEYISNEGVSPDRLSRILLARDAPLEPVPTPIDRTRPVIPQKQEGYVLLQIQTRRGELSADQLDCLASLAAEYGDAQLYFTHRQNVEIHSIDAAMVDTVISRVHAAGLATEGFMHILDMVSCVGTTFCNLAVSDTPAVYREIMDSLGARADYRETIHHILINMNGCPNSCGQHTTADIGLRGMRLPSPSGSVEAFELSLGGAIYEGIPRFNEPVAVMPAGDCVRMIALILDTYCAKRSSAYQSFRDFYDENGREFFASLLAAHGCRPPKGLLADAATGTLNTIPLQHERKDFSDVL